MLISKDFALFIKRIKVTSNFRHWQFRVAHCNLLPKINYEKSITNYRVNRKGKIEMMKCSPQEDKKGEEKG